jgi:2-methylisocitrate lyase-like PEP mutase family enzyme
MAQTFDSLLREPGILVLPGAHDPLSARIAVRAGARAVYMTGFGVAAAGFGVPDIGIVNAEQMIERVRVIANTIAPVPLIADGDNGHGGPLNVANLVRAYEREGAQCIQLEDQVSPKRCGHMEGKEVIPLADAAAKIRAAVDARSSKSFKIMARTDARATHDLDEALRRGEALLKAGSDILFIEAPRSEDELAKIAKTFPGTPLVANLVEDGKTPMFSPDALQQMGYKIALYPISAVLAVSAALERTYARVLGKPIADKERVSFAEHNEIVGLSDFLATAKLYETR